MSLHRIAATTLAIAAVVSLAGFVALTVIDRRVCEWARVTDLANESAWAGQR